MIMKESGADILRRLEKEGILVDYGVPQDYALYQLLAVLTDGDADKYCGEYEMACDLVEDEVRKGNIGAFWFERDFDYEEVGIDSKIEVWSLASE